MRPLVCVAFAITLALAAVAAPPDPGLKKAGEQFEKAMADADKALRAALVKASEKGKDKAALTKIGYEFDRFEKYKELPTVVPTKDYLRSRDDAVKALATKYEPAVKALRSAKKAAEADELEQEYADLLKKGRGFGLAVPDPLTRPLVVIRTKDGNALEPVDPKRPGSFIAVTKYVRGKASQVWRLERGEDGVAFRSSLSNLCLHVPASTRREGDRLVLWGADTTPPNTHYAWKAEERLREAVLTSVFNDLALTAKEFTDKGVLNTFLAQEPADKARPDTQVWKIELAK